MVAPVKISTKKREENLAIAKKVFNEIISTIKKGNPNNNVNSAEIEMSVRGHGERPFGTHGKDAYIDLSIKINKCVFDGLGKYDCIDIAKELHKLFEDQKTKRGWKNLVEEQGEIFLSYGNFSPDFLFPSAYRLFSKPTKEFDTLNKLLNKHCGKTLAMTDLYRVGLFGKSGQYGESGEKFYSCFKDYESQNRIDWIKKYKKSTDKLSFEIVNDDDIDTDYSRRYLTECYGYRVTRLKMVIKKANGEIREWATI